ncbi:MAG: PIN domain-containing protein [Verrucomicrobiales bacterium]|nr:PIN domain-containing protein [Verrucomicrobiales bacterium]
MNADFPVVLDACVLTNQRVTDLLLRLAETPRLYVPKWSARILDETDRTLLKNLNWPEDLVHYRREQLATHFSDAAVDGYEPIEECLKNDPKDRHVLAAAIRARCEVIVTFNLKDFPAEALTDWNVEVQHPSKFLANLYSLNSGLVVQRLHQIAANLKKTVPDVLDGLVDFVPAFALQVASDLGIDL